MTATSLTAVGSEEEVKGMRSGKDDDSGEFYTVCCFTPPQVSHSA
jgi:hypothetical protein